MKRQERLDRDGAVDPILFYNDQDKWGCFSSFSLHGVLLPDPWEPQVTMRMYATGEHRFQALKAVNQADHDLAAEAQGPAEAKRLGRSIELHPQWGNAQYDLCWWVMLETVMAKTLQ